MGAYCLRASIPSHTARTGEIMEVLWSDYYGALPFGDRREIACISHKGCRLEIVGTPPTPHRKAHLLVPGQVIRYRRSFFLGDRFELPTGFTVGLGALVGFKLQLAPEKPPTLPVEDIIVGRARHQAEVLAGDGPGAGDAAVPARG